MFLSLDAMYSKNPQSFNFDSFLGKIHLTFSLGLIRIVVALNEVLGFIFHDHKIAELMCPLKV